MSGDAAGEREVARLRRQYAALGRILAIVGAGDELRPTLDAMAGVIATALAADTALFVLDDAGAALPSPGADDRALVVPLPCADGPCGALALARDPAAPPFAPDDADFAREIAAQAAVAIDRARRDAGARSRAARAEALREIGRALSAELDFDRFLALAREQVARIVEYGSCWLALWDEATGELDFRLYIADGERLPDMEIRQKRGKGLAWALIDERRTLNTDDYVAECHRRGLRPAGRGDEPRVATNPWLGVPLLAGGRLVGALAVQRLNRPFDAEEAATLELLAGQIAAALENARLYAEARQLACCDPLTGLVNHRTLHERLDRELARVAAAAEPLAAVMADLDDFKLFNDTYGHPVGDQVLRVVAAALAAEAGPGDIVGRYGGDEFLAILPGTGTTGALDYLERVRARLASDNPALGAGSAVPLALSGGVAVYPHDARTRHDLIALADSALYISKRGGGRTVVTAGAHAGDAELAAHTGFGVVEGLVLAVDAKDHYTVAHSVVVADAAVLIAEALGLPARDVATLRTAGLLHDVGKISIPDRILRKPGPLTREEWDVMRQHVEFGELIIRGVPALADILEPVMHHHERWDGRGYPRGLAGEAVPLLGRIMVVADAYSAMVLDRPYRRGLSVAEAVAQLRAGAGSQFDPALAGLLADTLERQACPVAIAS